MSGVTQAPRRDGTDSLLTSMAGAAEYLNVPVSSLKYYVLKGNLKPMKVGPYLIVDIDRVQEVLREVGYKRREKPVK